jgi:endonuclease G, mitochondrial
MRKQIRFEVLLSENPSLQAKAQQEISQQFGSRLEPVFDTLDIEESSRLGRFFELTLKSDDSDMWDLARELVAIDGVSDVDPDISEDMTTTLAAMLQKDEESPQPDIMSVKKKADKPNPRPNWFHEKTHFPEAIQYAKDEHATNRGHFDGTQTGIRVGHLDTGYTNHPEIEKIKKDKGHNYIKPPFWKSLFGNKWRRNALDPVIKVPLLSWASHGTSSSSLLIGDKTRSHKFPEGKKDHTDGVFPYVDVIPYRISASVISFTRNIARGAGQAVKDGCKIITVSHATIRRSRMLEEVISYSYDKGVIWTAAAGTHFAKLKKIWIYPSKFPETIALAASTIDDEPWEWTHSGVAVDLCAPGYRIYRPYAFRKFWNFGPVKYGYDYSDGSTFSAPITAGAAALWLAHHGEEKLNQQYKEGWQRVEAFRKVMKESATEHKDPKHKGVYGEGLLNVVELLKMPLPDASQLSHAQPFKRVKEIDDPEKKKELITEKELIYLTSCAKVATNDQQGDELFKYVDNVASSTASEILKQIVDKKIKDFAAAPDPDLKENPKSEALKQHIKHIAG